jgi:hypothetical protein
MTSTRQRRGAERHRGAGDGGQCHQTDLAGADRAKARDRRSEAAGGRGAKRAQESDECRGDAREQRRTRLTIGFLRWFLDRGLGGCKARATALHLVCGRLGFARPVA